MKIIFKDLSSRELTFDIDPGDTVEQIKGNLIEAYTDESRGKDVIFFYKGDQISKNRSLNYYKVKEGEY